MFGVKKVYGLCLLATAGLTLLSPVAAKLDVIAFIVVRVLQGGNPHKLKTVNIGQTILTYFVRGGIKAMLTSCLTEGGQSAVHFPLISFL